MFHHVIVSLAEHVLISDQQTGQSGKLVVYFANMSDMSWASSHVILTGSWQYALGLYVHVLNLVLFNGLVNPNDGASLEFSQIGRAHV